ncbi:hypothetical protein [Streptomyces sp. NRRL S-350]|uniref:hypothetical protein n=1 Tax=Streptomyces sp. NRRL S-350 TaxID=1463902 RepID=UPI0004BED827|nr:hypothetical protein [Streptomyces sp. NRRL S-350]
MPPASRSAALAAALVLIGTATGCSLLAAPDARTPGNPAPVPPKQVVLKAAQALDDAGGARIEVVQEGPAGRRTASGTLVWGPSDGAALTVADEAGPANLAMKDGAIDLTYQDGAVKHADRATAESIDPAAAPAPDGYAGGWMTALVTDPGSRAYAIAQTVKLGSLGGEQLAGMTVAHYQGFATADEFFGSDQELTPQRRSATVEWYRQRGVTAIGFDVWVGPGERLLRLRETARGTAGTTVTTTDVPSSGTDDATPAAGG